MIEVFSVTISPRPTEVFLLQVSEARASRRSEMDTKKVLRITIELGKTPEAWDIKNKVSS